METFNLKTNGNQQGFNKKPTGNQRKTNREPTKNQRGTNWFCKPVGSLIQCDCKAMGRLLICLIEAIRPTPYNMKVLSAEIMSNSAGIWIVGGIQNTSSVTNLYQFKKKTTQ
jgi:hypothetical protein